MTLLLVVTLYLKTGIYALYRRLNFATAILFVREYNRQEVEKLHIVSLFDGISCGKVALDRIEIAVDSYAAFEIF